MSDVHAAWQVQQRVAQEMSQRPPTGDLRTWALSFLRESGTQALYVYFNHSLFRCLLLIEM